MNSDHDRCNRLLYEAWTVIANVGVHRGGWVTQHDDWRAAAERWRDQWHATLPSSRPQGDLCPNGCGVLPDVNGNCACAKFDVLPKSDVSPGGTTPIEVAEDNDRA